MPPRPNVLERHDVGIIGVTDVIATLNSCIPNMGGDDGGHLMLNKRFHPNFAGNEPTISRGLKVTGGITETDAK